MAGYRRVNYYELCRLCTSSEGTKTHIFREEGRRRQLPTKIQICLPVQVCEDDSLPKIICSHCMEKLESFYDFRESCVNAESMLESYFTSLRYSDDFSREGKVYVKEGSPPKKKAELEPSNKKPALTAADGLSSLVQAAGIQIVSDGDSTRVQQYKCAMQMQGGAAAAGTATAEARYTSYEVCSTASPRPNSEPGAKQEDGSTQCNETDFKNGLVVAAPDSSDEVELVPQQEVQSVALAAAGPGQEMLLHFSFKQERDGILRTEEQTTLQRSSIAQIGEFLRMKTGVGLGESGLVAAPLPVLEAAATGSLRPCPRCGKPFASLEELQGHAACMQQVALSPGDAAVDTDVDLDTEPDKGESGPISCEVCSKPFKRKEHLFQHRKLHTGERPYMCSACGKAFSRKEHLVRHTVSHTGQKGHACDMCGKAFSRKDNLHKHRKTHGVSGPYVCQPCGKSFVVKHNFIMHRSSHAACSGSSDLTAAAGVDDPLPYRCDICQKGFAMKQYLLTHKQRHRNKAGGVRGGGRPRPRPQPQAHTGAGGASAVVMMQAAAQLAPEEDPPPQQQPASPGQPHPGSAQQQEQLAQQQEQLAQQQEHLAQQQEQQAQQQQQQQLAQQQEQRAQQQQQQLAQQQEQLAQQQEQLAQQQEQLAQQQEPDHQQPEPGGEPGQPLPLAALPGSPLLAPGLLQHVTVPGTSGSASSTMATMIQVSSAAGSTYLCTPSSELLETYRRLHSA